jgi:ribosomal protein L37E
METGSIKCSRCGMNNPNHSKYCRGCGYELPKTVVVNTVAAQPDKQKKKVSLGLAIGLTAGGLIIGLILGVAIGGAAFYFYQNGVPQNINPTANKVAMSLINDFNKNLPVMLDSETRLDNVMFVDNQNIRYTFSLINVEEGKVDPTLKEKMEPQIINNVKTSPQMEPLRKLGIIFNYYYKDKNGNYLFSILVTPDMYK